jgi:hypothetical protein
LRIFTTKYYARGRKNFPAKKQYRFLKSGKIATARWVVTQGVVTILPLPEEPSSLLLHGDILISRKFLLARV